MHAPHRLAAGQQLALVAAHKGARRDVLRAAQAPPLAACAEHLKWQAQAQGAAGWAGGGAREDCRSAEGSVDLAQASTTGVPFEQRESRLAAQNNSQRNKATVRKLPHGKARRFQQAHLTARLWLQAVLLQAEPHSHAPWPRVCKQGGQTGVKSQFAWSAGPPAMASYACSGLPVT